MQRAQEGKGVPNNTRLKKKQIKHIALHSLIRCVKSLSVNSERNFQKVCRQLVQQSA